MNSPNALPLAFGASNGPAFLPDDVIKACPSRRCAVRLCWLYRRSRGMTQRTLAELADLYPSHVSEYLAEQDLDEKGRVRRSLPADKVQALEEVCGNRAISQWEMRNHGLTIMEEVIAERAAA